MPRGTRRKKLKYRIHSHRNALTILENDPGFLKNWQEIQLVLNNLTDERLIHRFNKSFNLSNKSLSTTINQLLKDDFSELGWSTESPIFQEPKDKSTGRKSNYWRLDMAKEKISMEVAFNHSGVTAWNLLKPVLASELNHVEKAIQTEMGVIICATQSLKKTGNFDGAIGTYERFLLHLDPLRTHLSVPLLIIGLEAPETFVISERRVGNRKLGEILMLDDVNILSEHESE